MHDDVSRGSFAVVSKLAERRENNNNKLDHKSQQQQQQRQVNGCVKKTSIKLFDQQEQNQKTEEEKVKKLATYKYEWQFLHNKVAIDQEQEITRHLAPEERSEQPQQEGKMIKMEQSETIAMIAPGGSGDLPPPPPAQVTNGEFERENHSHRQQLEMKVATNDEHEGKRVALIDENDDRNQEEQDDEMKDCASTSANSVAEAAAAAHSMCAGCSGPIRDKFIFSVIDLLWHQDCVQCCDCLMRLHERCFTYKGKLYCPQDYWRRFGPKCFACRETINKSELVQRIKGNRVYHLKCFTCSQCKRRLERGEELHLIDEDKQLLCKQDYQQLQASGKLLNQKPISCELKNGSNSSTIKSMANHQRGNSFSNGAQQYNSLELMAPNSNNSHSYFTLLSPNQRQATESNGHASKSSSIKRSSLTSLDNMQDGVPVDKQRQRRTNELAAVVELNDDDDNEQLAPLHRSGNGASHQVDLEEDQVGHEDDDEENEEEDDDNDDVEDDDVDEVDFREEGAGSGTTFGNASLFRNDLGNNNNNLDLENEENRLASGGGGASSRLHAGQQQQQPTPLTANKSKSAARSAPATAGSGASSTASVTPAALRKRRRRQMRAAEAKQEKANIKQQQQLGKSSILNGRSGGGNGGGGQSASILACMQGPATGSGASQQQQQLKCFSSSSTSSTSSSVSSHSSSSQARSGTANVQSQQQQRQQGRHSTQQQLAGANASNQAHLQQQHGENNNNNHHHHHHHNNSQGSTGGGGGGGGGHKPTRVRTVLNEKQLQTLRDCYAHNPRPDALMKEQLVDMTGLSPRVIRVWFQNKRCKDKKKSILYKQMQQHEKDGRHLAGLTHIRGVPLVASSPIQYQDEHSSTGPAGQAGAQADSPQHSVQSSPVAQLGASTGIQQQQQQQAQQSPGLDIHAYQPPWESLVDYAQRQGSADNKQQAAGQPERLETTSPRYQQLIGQMHGYTNQAEQLQAQHQIPDHQVLELHSANQQQQYSPNMQAMLGPTHQQQQQQQHSPTTNPHYPPPQASQQHLHAHLTLVGPQGGGPPQTVVGQQQASGQPISSGHAHLHQFQH